MSKHTPGPWSERNGRIFQTDREELTIANVGRAFDGDYSPANARLIAAAPDLLEALKELDEAYCRAGTPLSKDERHEDRMRLIAARAAITKATGDQV
jgi:hypothetical protein